MCIRLIACLVHVWLLTLLPGDAAPSSFAPFGHVPEYPCSRAAVPPHPEFKELRKQWRKVKKEQEQERDARGPAQRRRRATDPHLFPQGDAALEAFDSEDACAEAQHQLQAIGALDMAYPADGGAGYQQHQQPQQQHSQSLGQIGYGHHHYAAPSAYAPQRADAAPSPPPLNRLPANSSLLAPLSIPGYAHAHAQGAYEGTSPLALAPQHPAPAAFHPSLPLPRIHEAAPPDAGQQGGGRAYDAYGAAQR